MDLGFDGLMMDGWTPMGDVCCCCVHREMRFYQTPPSVRPVWEGADGDEMNDVAVHDRSTCRCTRVPSLVPSSAYLSIHAAHGVMQPFLVVCCAVGLPLGVYVQGQALPHDLFDHTHLQRTLRPCRIVCWGVGVFSDVFYAAPCGRVARAGAAPAGGRDLVVWWMDGFNSVLWCEISSFRLTAGEWRMHGEDGCGFG